MSIWKKIYHVITRSHWTNATFTWHYGSAQTTLSNLISNYISDIWITEFALTQWMYKLLYRYNIISIKQATANYSFQDLVPVTQFSPKHIWILHVVTVVTICVYTTPRVRPPCIQDQSEWVVFLERFQPFFRWQMSPHASSLYIAICVLINNNYLCPTYQVHIWIKLSCYHLA